MTVPVSACEGDRCVLCARALGVAVAVFVYLCARNPRVSETETAETERERGKLTCETRVSRSHPEVCKCSLCEGTVSRGCERD